MRDVVRVAALWIKCKGEILLAKRPMSKREIQIDGGQCGQKKGHTYLGQLKKQKMKSD